MLPLIRPAPSPPNPADVLRFGFQDNGVSAHARTASSISCPRLPDIIPAVAGRLTTQPGRASPNRRRKFAGARVQLMTDPYLPLTSCSCMRAAWKSGDSVYNPIRGKEGAHRVGSADALQPARRDQ